MQIIFIGGLATAICYTYMRDLSKHISRNLRIIPTVDVYRIPSIGLEFRYPKTGSATKIRTIYRYHKPSLFRTAYHWYGTYRTRCHPDSVSFPYSLEHSHLISELSSPTVNRRIRIIPEVIGVLSLKITTPATREVAVCELDVVARISKKIVEGIQVPL